MVLVLAKQLLVLVGAGPCGIQEKRTTGTNQVSHLKEALLYISV